MALSEKEQSIAKTYPDTNLIVANARSQRAYDNIESWKKRDPDPNDFMTDNLIYVTSKENTS